MSFRRFFTGLRGLVKKIFGRKEVPPPRNHLPPGGIAGAMYGPRRFPPGDRR